jgi:putative membrane protein
MMWSNHGGWGTGDWLAMSVLMIVFWALIATVLVSLIRGSRSRSRTSVTSHHARNADQELTERFASGEIDQDEYTRQQARLRTQSHS